jgi:hypothetical protein
MFGNPSKINYQTIGQSISEDQFDSLVNSGLVRLIKRDFDTMIEVQQGNRDLIEKMLKKLDPK